MLAAFQTPGSASTEVKIALPAETDNSKLQHLLASKSDSLERLQNLLETTERENQTAQMEAKFKAKELKLKLKQADILQK